MRAISALLLLIAAAGGGVALAASPTGAPWGGFSRRSADGHETTTLDIRVVAVTNLMEARPETTWISEKVERVWVVKKTVTTAGAPTTVQWTDSRACYQLTETLAGLTDLDRVPAGPSPTLVEVSRKAAVYRVTAPGVSPDASAAAIVDKALAAWTPCWSDTPPTLAPRP